MNRLLNAAFALFFLVFSALAYGADASSLKPPPGAKVAIVVFEDLECPTCAQTYPVVWETANAHHVPVMLHDFPLPMHPWSFKAAVFARFFDTRSEKLGNDFRGFVYRNQPQITPDNLRQWVDKFASDNRVALPFVIDPEGKLEAKVRADYSLGQTIGLEHTPTIFVIGKGGVSTPFVEVVDPAQLSQIVENMQRKASAAAPAARKSPAALKKKQVRR